MSTLVLGLAVTTHQVVAEENWYAEAIVGKRWIEDTEFVVGGVSSEADVSGFGLGGSGAFGYRWRGTPKPWLDARFEFEGGHAENEPVTLQAKGQLAELLGPGEAGIDGNVMGTWTMANVWFDMDVYSSWTLTFGGGLGAAHLYYNKIDAGTVDLINKWDTVFAYQVGAGIGYRLTPRFIVSAYYRFLDTSDPTFDAVLPLGKLDTQYRTHNVFLGARYYFY